MRFPEPIYATGAGSTQSRRDGEERRWFGHAAIYATGVGLSSLGTWSAGMGSAGTGFVLLVVFVVLGLLLTGGLLYCTLATKARLRLKDEELATIKQELQERSTALAEAEGEIERLKKIPQAELLPMLKLAHEQRSPLAAIQNALDMLLQGYTAHDPALQDEMLNLARDRAATMLERVNDFLRLGSVRHAEIERKVQPVQLLQVLQRLIPEKRVQARWKAVHLETEVPDSLPLVTATHEDMEHLLSNLINNAIKYTDPGGKVTVSLREEDGSVVGTVEDTGVGISPKDLPRIFDEFYRAESAKDMAHGTGLGLSIVKRVADLYGGHLDVESEVGRGSRFTFTFPQAASIVEEKKTETFRDLHREVIDKGLCGQCGGCIAFCSADNLHALELDEHGFPRYTDETKCLACGICYLICPLTRDLDAEVRRRYRWRLPIGAYQRIAPARATDHAMLRAVTDRGVVTSLLLYMLENYLIQGAIVSQKTTAFSREPLIATTREEILRHCEKKPVFGEQARLEKTGFSSMGTYSPIIPAIKDLERMHLSCVAMVGTPCQIRTVRKMQCLGISSAHIVGYTIGLFCMGQLSLDALGRKKLEDRLHIDLADVDDLDVGEDLRILLRDSTAPGRRQAYGHAVRASSAAPSATLRASAQDSRSRLQRDAQDSRSRLQRDAQEGRLLRVPFEEVSQVARPTCLACTEFANDYADIAVGELGSPDGYATTITRTEKGDRVYHGALGQGYIAEKESTSPAELRSEKTRMLASVVAFARRKRERGEARLRELGAESD